MVRTGQRTQSKCADALNCALLGNYTAIITLCQALVDEEVRYENKPTSWFDPHMVSLLLTKAWLQLFPRPCKVLTPFSKYDYDVSAVVWSGVQFRFARNVLGTGERTIRTAELEQSCFALHREVLLGAVRIEWDDPKRPVRRLIHALEAFANVALLCAEMGGERDGTGAGAGAVAQRGGIAQWFVRARGTLRYSANGADGLCAWLGTIATVATSACRVPLEKCTTVPLHDPRHSTPAGAYDDAAPPGDGAESSARGANDAQAPLPAVSGWICSQDPSSKEWYYWHPETHASRWTLPRGWEKHFDAASGHNYYWHPATQEKSWLLPPMAPKEAPPPGVARLTHTEQMEQLASAARRKKEKKEKKRLASDPIRSSQGMGLLQRLCMRVLGRVVRACSAVAETLSEPQRAALRCATDAVWYVAAPLPGIDAAAVDAIEWKERWKKKQQAGGGHAWRETSPHNWCVGRTRIVASCSSSSEPSLLHETDALFCLNSPAAVTHLNATHLKSLPVEEVRAGKISCVVLKAPISFVGVETTTEAVVVYGKWLVGLDCGRRHRDSPLEIRIQFRCAVVARDSDQLPLPTKLEKAHLTPLAWRSIPLPKATRAALLPRQPAARTKYTAAIIRPTLSMMRALLERNDCAERFASMQRLAVDGRVACMVVCGGLAHHVERSVATVENAALNDCWLLVLATLQPLFNANRSVASFDNGAEAPIVPCWLRLADLPRHMCALQLCVLDDTLWALVAFDDDVSASDSTRSEGGAKAPRLTGWIGEQLISLRLGETEWTASCTVSEYSLTHPTMRGKKDRVTEVQGVCTVYAARAETELRPRGGLPPTPGPGHAVAAFARPGASAARLPGPRPGPLAGLPASQPQRPDAGAAPSAASSSAASLRWSQSAPSPGRGAPPPGRGVRGRSRSGTRGRGRSARSRGSRGRGRIGRGGRAPPAGRGRRAPGRGARPQVTPPSPAALEEESGDESPPPPDDDSAPPPPRALAAVPSALPTLPPTPPPPELSESPPPPDDNNAYPLPMSYAHGPAASVGRRGGATAAPPPAAPAAPSLFGISPPTFDPGSLMPGDMVDVYDVKVKDWYYSSVTDAEPHRVRIHYEGWSDRYDEWIERASTRLAMCFSLSVEAERARSRARSARRSSSSAAAGGSSSSPRSRSRCPANAARRAMKVYRARLDSIRDGRMLLADARGQLHIFRVGKHRQVGSRGLSGMARVLSVDHVVAVPISLQVRRRPARLLLTGALLPHSPLHPVESDLLLSTSPPRVVYFFFYFVSLTSSAVRTSSSTS